MTERSDDHQLPEGAEGAESVSISNDRLHIEIGETESGSFSWAFDDVETVYHEYFVLGFGSRDLVSGDYHHYTTGSYRNEEVLEPFPEEGEPGETYTARVRYTMPHPHPDERRDIEVLVRRSVKLDEDEPRFTLQYDVTNVGDVSVSDMEVYQYADFDYSLLYRQVGHHDPPYGIYVEDHFPEDANEDVAAVMGWRSDGQFTTHHLDRWSPSTSVLDGELNEVDQYPGDGVDHVEMAEKLWISDPLETIESFDPGDSGRATVEVAFGSSADEYKQTVSDPDPLDVGSQDPTKGATATTMAYVPGLTEDDDKQGYPYYQCAFPDGTEGTIPREFSPDNTFVGDKIRDAPDSLREFLSDRKPAQGFEDWRTFRRYRFKNSLGVEFESYDDATIDSSQPVKIRFNGSGISSSFDDHLTVHHTDDPELEFELWRFDRPANKEPVEPPSDTIVEEHIMDESSDYLNHTIARNFDTRTMPAHVHDRYVAAEMRTFDVDGREVDGVRAATIWGTSNPFTRELANDLFADIGDLAPLVDVPPNPVIYTWLEVTLLADGTRFVRVPDCSPFPKHAGYLADDVDDRSGSRFADSGLEVTFDLDEDSSNSAYDVAIGEDYNNVWNRFVQEFAESRVVPYYNSHSSYLFNHPDDWELLEQPVMVHGESADGDGIDRDTVLDLLARSGAERPLSPFEVSY